MSFDKIKIHQILTVCLNEESKSLDVGTLGGSVVIFIEDWRMEIGNSGLGLELSHNLDIITKLPFEP